MPDTTEPAKLADTEIDAKMSELSGWNLSSDKKVISKEFKFKGYYKTINFVNVVAWIAQEEKHHPDLEVNFGRVLVNYSTHDADGLTQKDFVCAGKIDRI